MSKKLTQEQVVEDFKLVHGGRYDYSLFDYVGNQTKVTVICKDHGKFEIRPSHHKQGQGCPTCGGTEKLTQERNIEQFVEKHGDRYDYSLVDYLGSQAKVIVICKDHGKFSITPKNHKQGQGCAQCWVEDNTRSQEQVIKDFRLVHGDGYDYSLVEYANTRTKVTVICKDHGKFEITPANHKRGVGCIQCKWDTQSKSMVLTQEQVIKDFVKTHGNRYDYSLVEYANSYTKVTVVCKDHSKFEITPNNHKQGQGCPRCKWDTQNLRVLISNPEQYQTPRQVYFVNFHYKESGLRFSKVGVCTNGLEVRYPKCNLGKDGIEITKSRIIETTSIIALGLEYYVKQKCKDHRIDTRHILKACGGGTETFSVNLLAPGARSLQDWLNIFKTKMRLKFKGEYIT